MIKSQQSKSKTGYIPLNMSKIKIKKTEFMSSEEALNDVISIDWSDDVLQGKTKVLFVEKRGQHGL